MSLGHLSRVKATKANSYNIKLTDDAWIWSCHITGIAITKDKRLLLLDNAHRKVKAFSRDMKFLSYISIPDEPWDIEVIDDATAIITSKYKTLVVLDISGGQLSIDCSSLITEKDHLNS